ncbi:MAG: hypothetical protein ACNA8W_18185 [Bradymonadaceae bacterium]
MTTTYQDTHHSKRRKAQRGISDEKVELVRQYGRRSQQPGGRVLFFMDKAAQARLKEAGENPEPHANLAAIFASDGALITTFRSANYRRARLHGIRRRR